MQALEPLFGERWSGRQADFCRSLWKSWGKYTDAEAKALDQFYAVMSVETFLPGHVVFQTLSEDGTLTVSVHIYVCVCGTLRNASINLYREQILCQNFQIKDIWAFVLQLPKKKKKIDIWFFLGTRKDKVPMWFHGYIICTISKLRNIQFLTRVQKKVPMWFHSIYHFLTKKHSVFNMWVPYFFFLCLFLFILSQ